MNESSSPVREGVREPVINVVNKDRHDRILQQKLVTREVDLQGGYEYLSKIAVRDRLKSRRNRHFVSIHTLYLDSVGITLAQKI
jgi:hypothetical protein